MLHIGIDATTWLNDRGFGRFTRELVAALAARNSGFRYTLVFDQMPRDVLPATVGAITAATTKKLTESAVGSTSRSIGYLWKLGHIVRQAKFDLFFFPAVYSYFPILARVPCVVCYHDTTAERFPDLVFPTSRNRRLWQLKTALARFQTTRAMTVSQASAQDVERILRIPKERIDVITEAADAVFRVIDDPLAIAEVRARFDVPPNAALLIYVGGLNPHKNLIGLLRAVPQILSQRADVHIMIVGDTSGAGFWDNVGELKSFVADRPALTNRVRFTGYVTDFELAKLLNAADALIFPSLWEGFGLPAVEAMSCGLPVLASRRGSLPEIVGDAGLFFDPEQPSSIAECVLRFYGDAALAMELRKAALLRAQNFKWERAAELAEMCFRRCLTQP